MAFIVKGLTTSDTGQPILPPSAKTDLSTDIATTGTSVRNALDAAGLGQGASDSDIAAFVSDTQTATGGAVASVVATGVGAVAGPAPSGGDDTAAIQAVIDGGARSIRLQTFGTYNVSTLTAPARDLTIEGIGSTINATTANPIIAANGAYKASLYGVRVNLLSESNKVTDAQPVDWRFTGRLDGRTERDSTIGALNVANFAGQGVASNIIGNIFHNYTDSTHMQLDNVGAGANLVLKNAHNPVRRGDKAAEYVGDGIFFKLESHDYAANVNRSLFFVDKDGRFTWTGATRTAGSGGAARFLANKAEDSLPAYRFELTNNHSFIARFGNALDIGSDVTYLRASVKAPSSMTQGLILASTAGDVYAEAAGGTGNVQLVGRARFRGTGNFQDAAGAVTKYLIVKDDAGGNFCVPLHAIA